MDGKRVCGTRIRVEFAKGAQGSRGGRRGGGGGGGRAGGRGPPYRDSYRDSRGGGGGGGGDRRGSYGGRRRSRYEINSEVGYCRNYFINPSISDQLFSHIQNKLTIQLGP